MIYCTQAYFVTGRWNRFEILCCWVWWERWRMWVIQHWLSTKCFGFIYCWTMTIEDRLYKMILFNKFCFSIFFMTHYSPMLKEMTSTRSYTIHSDSLICVNSAFVCWTSFKHLFGLNIYFNRITSVMHITKLYCGYFVI